MASSKEIIERWEHAFQQGDMATVDELAGPGFVDHNPIPGFPPTIEGMKSAITAYRAAFPDLDITDLEVIADGDTAASRWTAEGTNDGEFMGMPATGKRIRVDGMNFYKLAGGQVTDVWTQFDGVSMMQQLGMMPAPDEAVVS
jgi:steroid delta-isomerase-like uncharacterized protein